MDMQTRASSGLLKNSRQSYELIIQKLLRRVTKRKLLREEDDGVNYVEGKYFVKKGPLPINQSQILWLTEQARDHFLSGPSLLHVSSPIAVVGDIHGQFEDLVMIFETLKHPPKTNYLFLGDYVDRGENSIETICLLFAYACLYPNNVFVLRGNHEMMLSNLRGGFRDECISRISEEVFINFHKTFNSLPFAAVIDGETFCCHGGLGPHLLEQGLNGIEEIKRPVSPSGDCLAIDLMWADPSKEQQSQGFKKNKVRKISYMWSENVAEQFLKNEGLKMIVRAHEAVMTGYEQHLHPFGFTIFSAPHYVNTMDNDGAVMIFQNPGLDFKFVVYTKQ